MFKGKEFNNAKFVYSKDEYCYKEVIDDFANASKIGIITYNISKKSDDYLVDKLHVLDENIEVQIICNIPNRYEEYYKNRWGNDPYRYAAKNTISTYLGKLDPKKYNSRVEAHFNFDNHMKVIATNNIAYWGSANYSKESKNNFELGTITTDKEFIKYLFAEFFPEIKDASVPYYDEDYYELRLSLLRLINLCAKYKVILEESFLIGYPNDKFGFKGGETSFSEDDLSELSYILDELRHIGILIENVDYEKYDLEEEIDSILSLHESIELSNINYIIDNSEFYDYIAASYQSIYDDIFNEYASEAYDEYLNGYIDRADSEAQGVIDSLAEAVGSDIMDMVYEFDKLIDSLIEISGLIDDLSQLVVSEKIDNT